MLWFDSFLMIPVSFFLADQTGGGVYGLICYWVLGFDNSLLFVWVYYCLVFLDLFGGLSFAMKVVCIVT